MSKTKIHKWPSHKVDLWEGVPGEEPRKVKDYYTIGDEYDGGIIISVDRLKKEMTVDYSGRFS